jgi:hypothetical protein
MGLVLFIHHVLDRSASTSGFRVVLSGPIQVMVTMRRHSVVRVDHRFIGDCFRR